MVAAKVSPKVAVPCHYDMFADNAIDPKQFRSSMKLNAPDIHYHELHHGKPFLFSATS
jgi:L-ascorbate 6-phosphate lactonase